MEITQNYAIYHLQPMKYRLLSAIMYRRLYAAKSDIRAYRAANIVENFSIRVYNFV